MKKMAIVFVVLIFLFCLAGKVFAGGIRIDFVVPDEKTRVFADEFMREMQNKRILISLFTKDYFVMGYVGPLPDKKTGELRTAIGIFVSEKENFDEKKRPLIKIWSNELFSREEIRIKAKKSADFIFEFLKKKEF